MDARAIVRIAPVLVAWLTPACASSVDLTRNPDPPTRDFGLEKAECDEKASLCIVLVDESASFFRQQAIAARLDGQLVYVRKDPKPTPERVLYAGGVAPGPHTLGLALWYEGLPQPSRRQGFLVSSHRFAARAGEPRRITIVSLVRSSDLSERFHPELRYDETSAAVPPAATAP